MPSSRRRPRGFSLLLLALSVCGEEEVFCDCTACTLHGSTWLAEKCCAHQGVPATLLAFEQSSLWEARLSEFRACTGASVSVIYVPGGEDEMQKALERDVGVKYLVDGGLRVQEGAGVYDGYIVQAPWLPPVIENLESLSVWIAANPQVEWLDVNSASRETVSYDGNVRALPLDTDYIALGWRADVFERYNVSKSPQTLEELAEVAEMLWAKDHNDDGEADWGVCLSPQFNYFYAFMAPLFQRTRAECRKRKTPLHDDDELEFTCDGEATGQNPFFDVESFEPFVKENAGFEYAAKIFSRILRVSNCREQMARGEPCSRQRAFPTGRCPMVISLPGTLTQMLLPDGKYAPQPREDWQVGSNNSYWGRRARFPGTKLVWDAATNAMVNCTPDLCPKATEGVNYAPYFAEGGESYAVRQGGPTLKKNVLLDVIGWFSSLSFNLLPLSGTYRQSHLTEEARQDLIEEGWPPQMADDLHREVLDHYFADDETEGGNSVQDLFVVGFSDYVRNFEDIVLSNFLLQSRFLDPDGSVEDPLFLSALKEAGSKLRDAYTSITEPLGRKEQLRRWRAKLNLKPLQDDNVVRSPTEDRNNLSAVARVLMAVLITINLVFALSCALWTRRMRRRLIIELSQPQFLYTLCLGAVFSTLSTLTPLLGQSTAWCQARLWVYGTGFVVTTATLYSKMAQMEAMLECALQGKFYSVKLTKTANFRSSAFGPFLVMAFGEWSILALWAALAPLYYDRTCDESSSVFTSQQSEDSLFDTDVEITFCTDSVGKCRTTQGPAFVAVLAIYHVLCLLSGLWMCHRVRNLPSVMSEGKWVFTGFYSQLQVFVTAVPVLAMVRDDYETFTLLTSLVVCVSDLTTLAMIFLPKMFFVYRYYDYDKAAVSKYVSRSLHVSTQVDVLNEELAVARPHNRRRNKVLSKEVLRQHDSEYDSAIRKLPLISNDKKKQKVASKEESEEESVKKKKTRQEKNKEYCMDSEEEEAGESSSYGVTTQGGDEWGSSGVLSGTWAYPPGNPPGSFSPRSTERRSWAHRMWNTTVLKNSSTPWASELPLDELDEDEEKEEEETQETTLIAENSSPTPSSKFSPPPIRALSSTAATARRMMTMSMSKSKRRKKKTYSVSSSHESRTSPAPGFSPPALASCASLFSASVGEAASLERRVVDRSERFVSHEMKNRLVLLSEVCSEGSQLEIVEELLEILKKKSALAKLASGTYEAEGEVCDLTEIIEHRLERYRKANRKVNRLPTIVSAPSSDLVISEEEEAMMAAIMTIHGSASSYLMLDVTLIKIILDNLLSNAFKYGGEAPPTLSLGLDPSETVPGALQLTLTVENSAGFGHDRLVAMGTRELNRVAHAEGERAHKAHCATTSAGDGFPMAAACAKAQKGELSLSVLAPSPEFHLKRDDEITHNYPKQGGIRARLFIPCVYCCPPEEAETPLESSTNSPRPSLSTMRSGSSNNSEGGASDNSRLALLTTARSTKNNTALAAALSAIGSNGNNNGFPGIQTIGLLNSPAVSSPGASSVASSALLSPPLPLFRRPPLLAFGGGSAGSDNISMTLESHIQMMRPDLKFGMVDDCPVQRKLLLRTISTAFPDATVPLVAGDTAESILFFPQKVVDLDCDVVLVDQNFGLNLETHFGTDLVHMIRTMDRESNKRRQRALMALNSEAAVAPVLRRLIFVVSANDSPSDIFHYRAAGADGHIPKNLSVAKFKAKLASVAANSPRLVCRVLGSVLGGSFVVGGSTPSSTPPPPPGEKPYPQTVTFSDTPSPPRVDGVQAALPPEVDTTTNGHPQQAAAASADTTNTRRETPLSTTPFPLLPSGETTTIDTNTRRETPAPSPTLLPSGLPSGDPTTTATTARWNSDDPAPS